MIHLDDLLTATGGRLHGPAGATVFDSFCFNSRLVRPGQLFLAVKTEHACRGGATGVLCQRC